MPSRSDLLRFGRAQAAIVAAARRELGAFLAMLPGDPSAARAAVEEFFPALIRSYGEVGVALAAEWFEDTAPTSEVRVVLADMLPDEQVLGTARWALSGDPASRLSNATQRLVLQPGRRTIGLSAGASGARWARVPTKPDPCAFCRMLASRTDYASLESAGGDIGSPDNYHDLCGCQPVALWPGQPLPEGYDPDDYYAQYMAARDSAGSGDSSAILAAFREEQGAK